MVVPSCAVIQSPSRLFFYERRLNVLFPLLEGFHLDFIPVVW